ncbi:hypothetical protein LSTR_LSTR013980 [Laodelphax striatellus]|uniref:Uncharacterized protein n=1 Tax=Laodelphax striatellus TaxID=195883 RepID=A0A482XHU4_LAOST|nr:hypothetical protein LSTR_LSTR013980 [Laodelphax striatellus]
MFWGAIDVWADNISNTGECGCYIIIIHYTNIHYEKKFVKEDVSKLTTRASHHGWNLGVGNMLEMPRCRLSKTMERHPYLSIRMFNSLPQRIKDLDSGTFVRTMKTWLKGNPFYSLDEFLGSSLEDL